MRKPRSSQQCCRVLPSLYVFRLLFNTSQLRARFSPPSRYATQLMTFALSFAVALVCVSSVAYGQSSTATLSGTVHDQNGAQIVGASIALINSQQGTQRLTTTNGEGAFVFVLLPPGRYSVTATKEGFAPIEMKGVVVNVNDQVALNIELNIGELTQTVEIVEGASLINESPVVAAVVDRHLIGNLPLNGRTVQPLITLTPGATLTRSSGIEQGQFSINGQRADANYFTIDGVSANINVTPGSTLGQGGGGALPGLSAFGGTNNLVSVDALEEFKIQTSTYAPEFGRMPGGQVSMVTRSGSNDFHGTLFEYLRNDVFDATDWFTNANPALQKTALRQNDFGVVFSGPVLLPRFGEGGRQPWYHGRNRTFFFFSYEGLRQQLPTTQISEVPSLAARRNAPAQLQQYLNAFPLPTGPDRPNGFAEIAATFSNPSTLDATSIRFDHTFNEKLTLFGRYNYSPSDNIQRGGTGFTLNTLAVTAINTETLTGGVTWNVTPRVINDFRINWSRNKGVSIRLIDDFGGAVPLSESILFRSPFTSEDSLYSLSILPGKDTLLRVGSNAINTQRQVNVIDNMTFVAGSHQLKFGVDYRKLYPIFLPRLYSQNFSFNGVGITGTPPVGSVFSSRLSSATISSVSGALFPLFTNFSAYAQDTWKVTPRLVLTYGLRWELNPAPSERNGNLPFPVNQVDNVATLDFAPRGGPLYETTYGNFAPRVGVSFKLSERHGRETVVRSGFGIFYDLGTGTVSSTFVSFPFSASRSLPNPFFPVAATLLVPPVPDLNARPVTSLNAIDPNLKLPRTYQWNFALEQSLGSHQALSATYVGAAGRDLLRQESLSNPNPRMSFLTITRGIARSDYHALQLHFQRRLTRGLQTLMSYTWSKSLDTASDEAAGGNTPADRFDTQLDRGPSNFDVRHQFSTAVSYNIPMPRVNSVVDGVLHNWAVDAIFIARSATPVNVTFTRDIGFGSNFATRPDLVPDIPLYIDDPNVPGGRRINNTAFTGNTRQVGPFLVPVAARQGNLGRNSLRGFPLHQLDLAMRRQFNFTERLNLQFRAEVFNIFNHPNFADPSNLLGSVSPTGAFTPGNTFGRSLSMLGRALGSGGLSGGLSPLYQVGGPRSLQFGVKIQF